MAKPETIKATINLKAESMPALARAIEAICTRASMQIVLNANVSTGIAIEADDIDDLRAAISDVAAAIEGTEGAECKISAPGTIWHERRLDPTPLERYINSATLFEDEV